MALTSSSTLAEVYAQYDDNAGYEGNLAKARLFLEACRILKRRDPEVNTSSDGRSMTRQSIDSDLKQVQGYLQKFDTVNQPGCSFVRGRALL
jgi:hypothetical protein